ADGDSAPAGSLTINIVDDVPTAVADSNNVNEGALLTVTAAAGVLANDVAGADGFAAGGGVVGVRAAGADTTTAVTTGAGTNIAGLHGTLHLNADGSYTYQSTANNISSATTDVFVYTIMDGDGDLSTTTLTINLSDSGL
ncbi:Ig-like domain-containing protein, partial [Mesorhizobium sp. ArgA1]